MLLHDRPGPDTGRGDSLGERGHGSRAVMFVPALRCPPAIERGDRTEVGRPRRRSEVGIGEEQLATAATRQGIAASQRPPRQAPPKPRLSGPLGQCDGDQTIQTPEVESPWF